MGSHTWGYKKVEDVDRFKSIIESAIISTESYINDDFIRENFDQHQEYAKENFNAYLEEVEEGERKFDPDDIYYIDEDGNQVMYHQETYDQHIKRYKKRLEKLKTILHDVSDYQTYVQIFKDSYDLIEDSVIDYSIRIKNDQVYYEKWDYNEFGELVVENKFQILDDYFRVYGYPVCREDEFYITSPTGKNPGGWTDAEELIQFLDWYKDQDKDVQEPEYIIENKKYFGYDEGLYDQIRKLFNKVDFDLYVTFG